MKKRFVPLFALLCGAAAPVAKAPDCSGPDHYAANVTFVALKNAGMLTNDNVDFKHVTSTMLASQRTGKDLWRQVFRVRYPLKSGRPVEAIVSDASSDECSMSTPQIYVISQAL